LVALKILPPQTATGTGFIERFNREARALAKLAHPNIVGVHEFGQVNGLPYFIMEYVDGLNLRELEHAGKLSPREALQIVPQICEALQFAHDEGIVHRDIKPENILLDKKGRVKIADFGIAKILGGAPDVDLTQTKGTLGTPHYMAPEQMEKPASVDHRADIFSLGVVFYEMLTGELPLGKFGPPSSRKVEVDVRLDDVVLRALEKDPELRYQQAKQVKTAVDTIASAAAASPSPTTDTNTLAQEILSRDYVLDIRSCVQRGWKLVRSDFWPSVGITALLLALLGFASSVGGASIQHGPMGHDSAEITSAFGIVVFGPLMGGLMHYLLKKIRHEKATIETVFVGFSSRFLHLFLAGFVTTIVTWLGFICFLLPGIYVLVAWMFTLPLVVDKQLDFWSAMELSRQVVTKHWWKFGVFVFVLGVLAFVGVVALIVGMFVMTPVVLASMLYAYEDIFGGIPSAAVPTPLVTGPSGTLVVPGAPKPSAPAAATWTLATKFGLAAVGLVAVFFVARLVLHSVARHRAMEWQAAQAPTSLSIPPEPLAPDTTSLPVPPHHVPPVPHPSFRPELSFGPELRVDLTNLAAVNLVSGQVQTLPESVTGMSRGPERDSAAGAWMESAGNDFAYVGSYDGFYAMTRDLVALKRDIWESYTPGQLTQFLHDTGQDVTAKFGDSSPVNNPTNYTYGFRTRDGTLGLLQITASSENPSAATLRYKLFQQTANVEANSDLPIAPDLSDEARDALSERFNAASAISHGVEKDKALATVALAAAKAGEPDIVKKAIQQIFDRATRDETTHQAATLLAKHGLRKQAVDIAKGIADFSMRNRTLAELAQ
jgi:hypothetical protein